MNCSKCQQKLPFLWSYDLCPECWEEELNKPMNKQQILTNIQEFLQKDPSQLKKKDYRSFFGSLRESCEWLKRKAFTKPEIKVLQNANQTLNSLLTKYKDNCSKVLGTSLEGLQKLTTEFGELLNKSEPKKEIPKPIREEKTETTSSPNWWDKWGGAIQLLGVFLLLFLVGWLISRIKEQ